MPSRRLSAPLPLRSPAILAIGGASSGDHMETSPHVPSPALSLPPLPSSPFSSPPLLPLLPPLLQWNPSHSSSLSALAPPFTLDHVSPALHPSLQVPPCNPDPLLFCDFPSSVQLPPPHDEVLESLPSLSDSSPPGDADFSDWCRNAELHPEPRGKALGNTFEPTIYSRFAAPSGTGSAAAATLVEPFYSPYYHDSQRWSFNGHFGPLSPYYKHRTSLLFDGEASPAKRSDEVPLTGVTRPPFRYKAPSSLEDRPSTSQLPPHNTAADSLPSGSINPCYAHYYNDSELRALDDNFGPSSARSELGVALWNKPSDEELGSVKLPDELPGTGPPSSNGKLFLPGGKEHFEYQSTEWLLDDYPPEKYEREQDSASSYSIFNPQLSTSARGLNDPYVLGSAYDCYMEQLDSCSVYPECYYPSFKRFTSNEVYLPSNFTASTNISPCLLSGKVHHEVLPMVDDASVIPSRSKEANCNENMDPKGEYNEKRSEDYDTTNSNVLPAVSRRDSLSSNNHATESPLNLPSMLRLGDMAIAYSPSGCNFLDLNKSSESFSEAFDQHNLSVDSPCWKGTPASQQSLFTSDGMLFLERELIKNHPCDEPNQIPEDVGDPNNSAEQVGNLNFDYVKKSHVSEKPECSPVVSSNMQQILEFSENEVSDCGKDEENEIFFNCVYGEQTNQTVEAKKKVDAQHGFAAKFVEMESNSPNEFPPPKGIAKNIKGPSSTPLRKLEELVKLIHGSSVELLSTNCSEAEGLKPHDYKLLYAAISNISLLLKDKDIVGFHHCSGLEVACSENMSSSRNQNYDMKPKTISRCAYFDDDSGNLVIKGDDKKMTQTFENALSQSFTESEESRQASLYKNLWVQAELLACRLKQELAIGQMETDSESYNPPRSGVSSNLNSLRDLNGQELPLKTNDAESMREKESQFSASANHELSKAEDVESSSMARFEILKDRNNKSIHRNAELEYILDQEHASMHPVVNADIYSSLVVEKNSPMTADLADMGFIESVAEGQVSPSFNVSGDENTRQMQSGQSYMTYKQGTCPSGSGNELDDQEHAAIMHPIANVNLADTRFTESVADVQASPSSNVLGYGNTRQTLSGPLNGPLIHSYMTYKQGSCPSRSGDEDLFFEWVHVMEEDESTQ